MEQQGTSYTQKEEQVFSVGQLFTSSAHRDPAMEIMKHLDDKSLFHLCQTDNNMAQLCRDDHFWEARGVLKYGSDFKKLKERGNFSYRQKYISFIPTF